MGRAKNSARQECGFVAGVFAPVLSRAAACGFASVGTNRACGPALFSGGGSSGVAAQNRRGEAKSKVIRCRAEFFALPRPFRPFAGAPIRPHEPRPPMARFPILKPVLRSPLT